MSNNNSAALEDEHQIASLLTRWGHARDSDDWEVLARCFHDEATIHILWMSGPARDFIARSRSMAAARKPGIHIKHVISGFWIGIEQNHAFSRCHANLYVRTAIAGHEFDLQSWMRFFDLLEKRDNVWRIVKRTAVYDKDRLDPVDPRIVPQDLLAPMDLSLFPQAAKFLCYLQQLSGHPLAEDIVCAHSDRERSLREEGEMWIEKPHK